jgi:release factor glutamine methyltransferase
VTANPPYIATDDIDALPPDVRDHEPRLALEAGEGGLAVVGRLVADAPGHLVARGVLAIEVGAGQARDVAELFERAGFRDIDVRRDYGRIERVVSGVLRAE